ncbi:hypothetical protein [Streptomyces huiliensis]|uniref:hypothetical protein n=1 Tax=Streptomyces huiliensis TaxID=2876027 RepID=UPI001CBCD467|nr:hypothetical protein [Streptomyces huiliensis]MBZ4322897.1 hypothetical protein [Streptomyces huiliensis]
MKPLHTALALSAAALACTAALATPAGAAGQAPVKPAKFCTYIVDTGQSGCFSSESKAAAAFGTQTQAYKDLGRIWSDSNSGGNQLTFRGSQGCGWRYPEFASLGGDWNDKVSSAQGLACPITLWEHSDFRGAHQTYHGYNAYVGDGMNDKASSVSFDLN